MLPISMGPPFAPATNLPPEVAMAYAVFVSVHLPANLPVGSPGGEGWKASGSKPDPTIHETKAYETALRVLTQYMMRENYTLPTKSDFAKVGLCEWDELPPHVQSQMLQHFPPNWEKREALLNKSAEEIVQIRGMAQQVEVMGKVIEQLKAELEARPQRRARRSGQEPDGG